MGLSGALARLAVRATRVLVVEVPGHWATRMEVEHQLLRRPLDPDEIAATVSLCCSPAGAALNGGVVAADGGFSG